MAKSKSKKAKRRRPKPTAVPSIKELEKEEELLDAKADNAVFNVLEKLQGLTSDDKECGASIVAHMSENEDFVTEFIENDGLRILAPLLVDSNISVRHTTCGSLRNLSCSPDRRICEEMVKQDVLTPLVGLLKQYSTDWAPSAISKKKRIDSKKEIFIEACHLLSYLCESSDAAINIFNKSNLMSVLLPCLNLQTFGLEVVLTVVECLHTVTEDNEEAIRKIEDRHRDILLSFISIPPDQPAHVYLRTLASGVILNLSSGKIDDCGPSVGSAIMDVVDNTLQIAVQEDIEKVSNDINCYKEAKKDKYEQSEELAAKFSVLESNLNIMQTVLTAKKIALEMLANICCNDDNDGDWEDSSSASDEMTNLEELPSCSTNVRLDLPCEIHGIMVSKDIVQKVLQQIVLPSENIAKLFLEIPTGKEYFKRLHTVRCRALFCINNVVQGLSIEDLGGPPKVFQLFMDMCMLMFSQTDASDVEQLQAATSSSRAILQKLSEVNAAAHLGKMTVNDLQLFYNMWDKCQDSSVRVNILRTLATVACILANMKQENSHAMITSIGGFLIENAAKGPELWVIAEALDALFDVFSEDHLDYIAQSIGLVYKLKCIQQTFRGRIKQQRSSLDEHHLVIMTAKTNLTRFLKYKESCNS